MTARARDGRRKGAATPKAPSVQAVDEARVSLVASCDALKAEIARLDALDVDTHDLRNKFQALMLDVSFVLDAVAAAKPPRKAQARRARASATVRRSR